MYATDSCNRLRFVMLETFAVVTNVGLETQEDTFTRLAIIDADTGHFYARAVLFASNNCTTTGRGCT